MYASACRPGDDVDVLEIDGASNRGIDEIRQLRQNVAVRPSRVRYKIYIIDEVHMLTKEAFNALLKTLEEPPEHVKFIFATTEPHKIPITILSRCQRFDFAGISHRSIEERLAQIASAEGVTVDAEALAILASRAAGSMRDSQSLLEQLLAVGHERITIADVTELLGIAPAERLHGLVAQLVARNAAGALAEVDAIVRAGVEVGLLLDQLVGYFRDVMAAAVGCSADQMLYALPSQAEEVRHVSEKLGLSTVLAIGQILDQAAARMRFTMHGRTLVEIAVVRICQLDELDDIATLVAELRGTAPVAGASATTSSAKGPARAANEVTRPAPPRPGTPGASPAKKNDDLAAVPSDSAVTASKTIEQNVTAGPLNDLTAAALWQRAVVELGDTVAGSAAHADRIIAGGDDLIVAGFPAAYSFCRDICERPEMRSRLERALSQAHGGNVRLKLHVHDDAPTNREAARQQRTSRREQLAEVSERPFVRRAMEVFDVPAGQFRYTPPEGDGN
jgi:DNA polymerase-3 subunit gamma/tau